MSTEVGIEIAVTSVALIDSRKTRITMTANASPSRPSVASASIDCSMYGAWSKTTVNDAPGFVESSEDSRSGSSAVTAFDTSTVFAAGSFVTEIVRAGSPFTREMLETGLSASSTDATSAIVAATGTLVVVGRAVASGSVVPSVGAGAGASGTCSVAPSTGSAAISSTLPMRVPVCTAYVESPSVMVPAGTSRPFCSSASRIACCVMPNAASFAGSGVIVTRWPISPTRLASRTPSTSVISGRVVRSSSSESALTSSTPVTAICSTGKSSRLSAITCGSTSSGNWFEMRFTAESIFCSTKARSVP